MSLFSALLMISMMKNCVLGLQGTAYWSYYTSYAPCCPDSPNYDPTAPTEECDDFSACDYLGQFAIGSRSFEWVQANPIIAFFDLSDPDSDNWFSNYANKTIKLTANDITITATIIDQCNDNDCNNCCSNNAAKGGGYLVDTEYWTIFNNFGDPQGDNSPIAQANEEIQFEIIEDDTSDIVDVDIIVPDGDQTNSNNLEDKNKRGSDGWYNIIDGRRNDDGYNAIHRDYDRYDDDERRLDNRGNDHKRGNDDRRGNDGYNAQYGGWNNDNYRENYEPYRPDYRRWDNRRYGDYDRPQYRPNRDIYHDYPW